MNQHLTEGCEECQKAHDAWHGLAVFVEEDRAFEPPPDALRVAKSLLAQQNVIHGSAGAPPRRLTWTPASLATLVFDSMQAMPAGVRSGAGYSRHLLFAAQSLAIDLHVETASKPGWFLLAGQVADASSPDRMHRVELTLADGDTAIATFETNEFGEFQCTFDRRKNLRLLFGLESGAIALPLDVLFTPSHPLNSSES